jgi:hypothetical protein
MYLQFIQTEMQTKLIDKKLTFSVLKSSDNRLDFKFKTYNEKLQCGGWITEGYFLGDINDISENIFELLDSVYLKKRSFENIKIYSKTK